MATSIPCSICEKGQGTCLCAGCKRYFCMKDFRSHRNTLLDEMHVIVEDRNHLKDKMNEVFQHNDSYNILLTKIDEWQKNTIEKVEEAAEQARQQIKCISHSKRGDIINQFDKFSFDLIEKQNSEDFIEHDLIRLHQSILQLNREIMIFNQPTDLELDTERSDQIVWNQLIYIKEKFTHNDHVFQSVMIDGRDHGVQPRIEARRTSTSPTHKLLKCGGIACSHCSEYFYKM